jgi:hypothetical protein
MHEQVDAEYEAEWSCFVKKLFSDYDDTETSLG